jgi:hypothetical protein
MRAEASYGHIPIWWTTRSRLKIEAGGRLDSRVNGEQQNPPLERYGSMTGLLQPRACLEHRIVACYAK